MSKNINNYREINSNYSRMINRPNISKYKASSKKAPKLNASYLISTKPCSSVNSLR